MDSTFKTVSERILKSYWDFYPALASSLGLHQYDGRLSNLSDSAIASRVAEATNHLASLKAIPADTLGADERFDLTILEVNLRREVLDYTELRIHEMNPEAMVWHIDPSPYILRDYAPLEVRAEALASALSQAPRLLEHLAAHLMKGRAARQVLEAAIDSYEGMAMYYQQDVLEALDEIESSATHAHAMRSCRLAAEAVTAFVETLKSLASTASTQFAIGADRFAKLLSTSELVDTPLDTLLEMGRQDLRRNERRLEEVASAIDADAGVRAVAEMASSRHPKADALLIETADLLEEIRRFIVEHDLIGLPSDLRCKDVKTPAFMGWSFAAMDTPGGFETEATEAYYYVNPPREEWADEQKEEWLCSFSYGILRSMSVHEAYPGHFVQYLHTRTLTSSVRRTFWSYAFAEGWAHYVEEMMIEEGFGEGDPFAELGQLQDALTRNCRLICAIEMHSGGMTVERATQFFVDHAGMEETPARAEAVRGTFDPMYLTYTLGKLMFLRLRDDYKRMKGAGFSLREFHDLALSFGEPSIPLLRAHMLEEEIRDPFQSDRC